MVEKRDHDMKSSRSNYVSEQFKALNEIVLESRDICWNNQSNKGRDRVPTVHFGRDGQIPLFCSAKTSTLMLIVMVRPKSST
eukprot:11191448-Ditylum_brightwellii.AAC.1